MGLLTEFATAVHNYPHEYLELEIIEIDPERCRAINRGEKCSFMIQVTNTGPLDVLDLGLFVEGLNGTKVASNGAWHPWVRSLTIVADVPAIIPGHSDQVITPIPSNMTKYLFKALSRSETVTDLVRVSVGHWNGGLEHPLVNHSAIDPLAQTHSARPWRRPDALDTASIRTMTEHRHHRVVSMPPTDRPTRHRMRGLRGAISARALVIGVHRPGSTRRRCGADDRLDRDRFRDNRERRSPSSWVPAISRPENQRRIHVRCSTRRRCDMFNSLGPPDPRHTHVPHRRPWTSPARLTPAASPRPGLGDEAALESVVAVFGELVG